MTFAFARMSFPSISFSETFWLKPSFIFKISIQFNLMWNYHLMHFARVFNLKFTRRFWSQPAMQSTAFAVAEPPQTFSSREWEEICRIWEQCAFVIAIGDSAIWRRRVQCNIFGTNWENLFKKFTDCHDSAMLINFYEAFFNFTLVRL